MGQWVWCSGSTASSWASASGAPLPPVWEQAIDNDRGKAHYARHELSEMNRLSPLHLALYVLLCLIWGTTWMAIKVGLRDAPPFWSAAIRFIIAVAILFLVNAVRRTKYPRGWHNKLRVAW